jgi:acylglycerol lipase
MTMLAAALSGCSANYPAARLPAAVMQRDAADAVFVMSDGARLPYRVWLPAGGAPSIVVLALHGFNDSRDAWELPAPVMAAAGLAVIAPDQRGFGAAPERGRWPGTAVMAADAGQMARLVAAQYPRARLYLMGESMGGAVLMHLAASPDAPKVAGYVLVAPAVWGRSQMNLLLRGTLWMSYRVAPGMLLSAGPVRVKASDNREALIRLGEDPRTLLRTRVAAVKGLVDLMSDAEAAAPRFRARALFMYGAHDELVPKRATAAVWREVMAHDAGARLAYYPDGYHLLLRDLGRAAPTADVIAWLRQPAGGLASGAETAAKAWLARQPGGSPRPRVLPGAEGLRTGLSQGEKAG